MPSPPQALLRVASAVLIDARDELRGDRRHLSEAELIAAETDRQSPTARF